MKVYIYPTWTPSRDKSGNLYIKFFHDAFEADIQYCVVNRCWKVGIASILMNLDAEAFIIQWVDLIPGKRLGKIQFVFFLMVVSLIKLIGKRLIWVLHNKHAHAGKSRLVVWGMRFMAHMADDVVVHSTEGITFFDQMFPNEIGKCKYVPHPVYSQEIYLGGNVKYNYVIWGSIGKHKNVLEFIRFFNQEPFFKDKTLLVCGRCAEQAYHKQIKAEVSRNVNIDYKNAFMDDDELRELICKARIILFTYNPESVLSSGALIYSLNFFKPIIGPRVGNFADMEGVVTCYDRFEEIPKLEVRFNEIKAKEYIAENTWETLPSKIMKF